MKILKNKYFILGNILLILFVIPLTLFFISRNQANRTKAAPSTILSLTPPSVQAKKGQQFDLKVMVNPGQNIVSIVDMYLLYDATKLKLVTITPNKDAFPTTLRGPIIQNGSANISLNIGSDVTKAVTATTQVATLTFEPLDNTPQGPTKVSFDQATSRVFSLSSADNAGENVLQSTQPADVTISDGGGGVPPTITPPAGVTSTPSPTGGIGGGGGAAPTATPLPTLTPTSAPVASGSPTVNQPPICTGLSVDRALTGSAPYSLTFTANGNDPDSTISKVAFDFGDGPVQTLNSTGGIGTNAVSISISHTYNNPGSYTTTVTLTDGGGKSSLATSACQKTITVTAANSGSSSGGAAGGGAGGSGGAAAGGQPKPTLESPGGLTTTLGIIGGILFTIIGGAILLAL